MQPGGNERASNDERLCLEREVLRAIFQSMFPGGVAPGEAEIRRLANYRFHGLTHQVIFDALCEVRPVFAADSGVPRETIHQQLLQYLTRKGFPDLELEAILEFGVPPDLQAGSVKEDEFRRIVLRLTTANERATQGHER